MTSTAPRAFVVGLGALTAAGRGVGALRAALRSGVRPLRPPSRLSVPAEFRLPGGEVPDFDEPAGLPRTHALAREAAREALRGRATPPDAVVLGVTTGGIGTTERLFAAGEREPARYALHGAGTVAELVARDAGCTGPALTVATACSSGAVALAIALELLRSGRSRSVLAGGVDGLCRLTWHGFRLLQLVDPRGTRPLDADRSGLTVAEGAGMVLLVGAAEPPEDALAELRGAGLTCDAHHPTQPLPGGEGARRAIVRALADAGIDPADVGYVNLHGTGTTDNDAAEAAAVRAVWPAPPPVSSTKGITGHPLAAAGAVEAVVAVLALREGLLPPNVGLGMVDPALGLDPLREPVDRFPRVVVSNSFGFGGNNAVLVFERADERSSGLAVGTEGSPSRNRAAAVPVPVPRDATRAWKGGVLEVLGAACLSGAGGTEATLAAFRAGASCAGTAADEVLTAGLPPRVVRRIRRLPRMALALSEAARDAAGATGAPRSVFFGTAWGPLSETHEFLAALFASGDRFASPTDFVGSVHNAPAGGLAIRHGASGPNVTATAGDASFEQALFLASLFARGEDEPILAGGADEFHPVLSPLVAPTEAGSAAADGGGLLVLRRANGTRGIRVVPVIPATDHGGGPWSALVEALGGAEAVRARFGAVFTADPAATSRPAAADDAAASPRREFGEQAHFEGPVIDARRLLGAYATVSAAATVVAVELVRAGTLPAALAGGRDLPLEGRGILVASLGPRPAAIAVLGPGNAP
ncbi:MAG: beta-ketoacyl synthase chain length factor [Deltaproteobacteria bacterium]|nr:beta-ketoacyl synthase chain length factor [Deltaproteobacteria bacterium]